MIVSIFSWSCNFYICIFKFVSNLTNKVKLIKFRNSVQHIRTMYIHKKFLWTLKYFRKYWIKFWNFYIDFHVFYYYKQFQSRFLNLTLILYQLESYLHVYFLLSIFITTIKKLWSLHFCQKNELCKKISKSILLFIAVFKILFLYQISFIFRYNIFSFVIFIHSRNEWEVTCYFQFVSESRKFLIYFSLRWKWLKLSSGNRRFDLPLVFSSSLRCSGTWPPRQSQNNFGVDRRGRE